VSAKIVFMRRSLKEIELFGGDVYIDIDGKNIGILKTIDYIIELENGKHTIKMYKSHKYDTYIGFAETEVDIKDGTDLLVKYSCPMVVTQPGNIIISDYKSEEQITDAVMEREQKLSADHRTDERKKKEINRKNRNGMIIFIILLIIVFVIIYSIYWVQLDLIFTY